MKRLLPALLLLISAPLFAQPQPCGNPAFMQPFCAQACVVCDINGFTGVNDAGVKGQAPPGFCTTQIHHMQWIAFIAGSTNLTLSLKVYNCQNGEGLEVGIYESFDCQSFRLLSNCDTDIPNNTTQNFTNIEPLVVGQYYYFVMDGSVNDVCKYTINVVSGTTQVPPLENSGVIAGEPLACSGTSSKYTVQLPPGAARFSWTLDGTPLASTQDTTINIDWNTPGTYNLCVTASNACDTAAPACRTVVVKGIAPTLISAPICEGECFEMADTMVCTTGLYDFHFSGSDGCDSLVRVNVQVLPASITNLNLLICDGDSVMIGNHAFFESGEYQELLATQNTCDSTVNLKLQVIQCEIKGGLNTESANCNGSATGSLEFSVQNGTPPFQYNWTRIGVGTPFGNGNLTALNTLEKIENLPAGTYFITVSDNFGNDVVLFSDVTEPAVLTIETQLSDFHGSNISCQGLKDGSIRLSPYGGLPPYRFQWNNGSQSPQLDQIAANTYTCTLTDAAGCEKVIPITLVEPEVLALNVHFQNPDCAGINTGSAQVMGTTGGTPLYEYDLSGTGFGPKDNFSLLSPGSYKMTVRDANGCEQSQTGSLIAPIIPEIELGPDRTVELGDIIRLDLTTSTLLDTFIWSAQPGLSCYNCPEPDAQALHTTTYQLTVTAPGGCTASDLVTVQVQDRRNVYIPNTFSPNDDGFNDQFTVYGGREVSTIKKLQVFSRWGELVFQQDNMLPNDESAGWDGRFRGKDLPPGVFTWLAQVEFIDGVVTLYQGSITVLW